MTMHLRRCNLLSASLRRLTTTTSSLHTTAPCNSKSNVKFMSDRYKHLKGLIKQGYRQRCNVNSSAVFAINQINCGTINVYGFDYDYTLAQYADIMQEYIYESALAYLVEHFKFPRGLRGLSYKTDFCIRGLHYDVDRSLLMKVDAFHIIQQGTVYRGLRQLEAREVDEILDGRRHIPKHVIDQSFTDGGDKLRQLMDVFSLPEMMLLSNVVDYFDMKGIEYDPKILFQSVQQAVRWVHVSGKLYNEVSNNLDTYLVKDCLHGLLGYLTEGKKTLFLITNSGFQFVDTGMRFMAGEHWRDAFDVVIVNARKPSFFHKGKRPFRQLLTSSTNEQHHVSWERITELRRGDVYSEGSVTELMSLSGWKHSQVLYFGDQIYNDLADVTLYYGWRTGAVIPELAHEISAMNSEVFGRSIIWLQTLERLLERMQIYRDAESQQLIREWILERDSIKVRVKDIFNPYFGSVFRSHLAPSFFAMRLCRIADVYMSSVNNLLHYHPQHFFFPIRSSLPHEGVVSMAFQHDGYDRAIEKVLRQAFQFPDDGSLLPEFNTYLPDKK